MRNKQFNELSVCGIEAVKAIAATDSTKIRRLYFTQDRAAQFGALCKQIAARRGIYNMVQDASELEKLCGSIHHQGVVAMIPQPEVKLAKHSDIDYWKSQKSRILILERPGNANNVGAIIRSAAFFGIEHIVISGEEAETAVTTSSYRVAQGGMEYVKLYSVFSVPRFVSELGNDGAITVIGTDVHSKNTMATLKTAVQAESGIALVLGNEETGISAETKNACTHLVSIKGSGKIESLNIAQAATLFLYALSVL